MMCVSWPISFTFLALTCSSQTAVGWQPASSCSAFISYRCIPSLPSATRHASTITCRAPPRKNQEGVPDQRIRGISRPFGKQKRDVLKQGYRQKNRASPAKLRVMGGSFRGRKLLSPEVHLRPMMGKVREAFFSQLTSYGYMRDTASILDMFSGSGAVGIEGLSRGMGASCHVDMASNCAETIAANLEMLGVRDKGYVITSKAEDVLQEPERFGLTKKFDVITITPPYEEVIYADLIQLVIDSGLLGEDSLLAVEYPVELGCMPPTLANSQLIGIRNRRYGRTVLATYVWRPTGANEMLTHHAEEFIKL